MTNVDGANPLARMLDNAFSKLDRDKDGKLDGSEFQSLYEILKPGISMDEDGEPTVSAQEYQKRMDADSDGNVSLEEMQGTGVLMPAELTDESLASIVDYLLAQMTEGASVAASRLTQDESS